MQNSTRSTHLNHLKKLCRPIDRGWPVCWIMTRNDLQEDQLSSYTIHASKERDSTGTIEMHWTSNSAYPNQDSEQCSSISYARGRIHQTGSQDLKKQQPTDLWPGRKRSGRQKHEAQVRSLVPTTGQEGHGCSRTRQSSSRLGS